MAVVDCSGSDGGRHVSYCGTGRSFNRPSSRSFLLSPPDTPWDQAIQTAMTTHPLQPLMAALQALRGVDWVTAATLVAECGDFSQFSHPCQLMAFTGLVPMESSSGKTQSRGHITKTGNVHVRRVLVESAHSYRFRPTMRALFVATRP